MSFASELWDQYPLVKQKISDDFHNLKILSDFISKCGKLQLTFGNALLKLSQTHKAGAGEYGTVGTAWESVKSEMERMARINIECSQFLVSEIAASLLDFKKKTSQSRKEYITNNAKKTKELERLKTKLKSATLQSEKCKKVLQVAQNNQGDKKAKQKIDKAQKNSNKAENELESATDNFNSFEKEYYSETIPKVLTDFEQLEKDRIELIKKNCLELSGNLKDSYVTKITELSTRMEKCAQDIDMEKDLYSYSTENKSGKKPPQGVIIPFTKPKSSKHSTQTSLNTENLQNNNQEKTEQKQMKIMENKDETQKTNYEKENENNNKELDKNDTDDDDDDDEDDGEVVDFIVTALYDYEAKDETDLAFSAGDSIHVVKKHTSGWWEGELDDKKGLFPMNFVSESGNVEEPEIQIGDKTRAIYDYEAEGNGELSIKENQIIIITNLDDGWYVGYIEGGDGTEGSFPGNYIEKI
ncbi:sh3 and f-bar domain-containing protein [Anaeramoeba flamelloides]|uniref:Sh3 and f-bar domain-containing protein n=1 Tax=Anaeramoeba flamelloides TaxID=1746091 RepID=A0AAV7Y888_9EUKA|nr:sh3 and f-bar domain-containing protein [Anaeramoeba flamelloides]